MKSFSRRTTSSPLVGIQLASDKVILAAMQPSPLFVTRAINGVNEWAIALSELFIDHGVNTKCDVHVVLSASLYQQVQIDKPQVPEVEMMGALPWAIKEYVTEPVMQLTMDYVDLPMSSAGRERINVISVSKSRIQQIADAVNGVATLRRIVSDELALASLYDAAGSVDMLLWQPKGQELQLLTFYQGGICFSRTLRGFVGLTADREPDVVLLDALALEIQRSVDYLVGQLKLPGLSQLQLAIASLYLGTLTHHLEQTFGFSVSALANKAILSGVEYLPAYGATIERFF